MKKLLRFGWATTALLLTAHAAAQVTLYEREDFRGRSFTAAVEAESLQRQGFNDRIASVPTVDPGAPREDRRYAPLPLVSGDCGRRSEDQARAACWDASYSFRGQEHRLQLNKAPGRTVTVSEQGEPRT